VLLAAEAMSSNLRQALAAALDHERRALATCSERIARWPPSATMVRAEQRPIGALLPLVVRCCVKGLALRAGRVLFPEQRR